MKFTKVLVFLLCLFLFIGCTKEETPMPKPEEKEESKTNPEEDGTIAYFTLNNSIASPDEENWLVIHDQSGILLDYKEFERGESLVFEALESELENVDELTITLLKSSLGTNNLHRIFTYTGIEKESVWGQKAESENGSSGKSDKGSSHIRSKPVQELTKKEETSYNIVVNNVPEIARFTLSSESNSITGSQIHQYTTTLEINEIELDLGVEYLLSIEDGQGKMKYLFLYAQETSEDINLDYLDFLEYNHVLEVALPEHYYLNAIVWGYDTKVFSVTSFLLSSQGTGGPSDSFARFGYIDNYEEFDTYFTVRTLNDYGYGYQELGQIPDTIAVMEKPSFTLQNSSIEGFNFTTEVNYLRRFSFWDFSEILDDNSINQTQWHIQSPGDNTTKIGALPAEIIERQPSLNLSKLRYNKTDFILKGRTYEDVLNSTFNQITVWPPVYEWVTFYNPEN